MEEQHVQKELKELCLNILRDDSPKTVVEHLTQVQMLYEKLLVLNYLNERKGREGESPGQATIDDVGHESKSHPEAKQRGEIINESPVPERELTDDKTPEELKAEIAETISGQKDPFKKSSINDRFSIGVMKIGLNDRIAFVKHLFDGSQEDFNRVLSQINTFGTYDEAENFIEKMIKPDYSWDQKEEYEMRFMDLVRNKFGAE